MKKRVSEIDVTFFATGDSNTGTAPDSVIDKPTSGMNDLPVAEEWVIYC